MASKTITFSGTITISESQDTKALEEWLGYQENVVIQSTGQQIKNPLTVEQLLDSNISGYIERSLQRAREAIAQREAKHSATVEVTVTQPKA